MNAMSTPAPQTLSSAFPGGPRLLADVGGTNARFALETAPGQVGHIHVLPCCEHPTLAAALRAYLALPDVAAAAPVVRHGAIAIANPVTGDFVRMTNHHWEFSIEGMRQECGFDVLAVVNDFTALARSLPFLGDQKRQVGGGTAVAGSPLGLIGAGTGLGVSGLIPCASGWTALLSEGGHVSFSPVNETEVAILQFAWREFEHVSAERLMSGAGIELIYRALADYRKVAAEPLSAADVARRALDGTCPLCDEAIEAFCGMLGTIAANLAVTLGAQGGIYIGGGIVPKLGDRFDRSAFRARFEAKGRFRQYLSAIPTHVITAQYPAFLGVSAILAERLAA
ncbi:glucokinase [Pseudoduganella flava]|uniref:Glucokinase n=1 Tax=Pseudoduganella flava TaxID=871742 RepID=A0A562Q3V4_9BURK|nr:glucokinase [Pseudoduganella flava]QGZ41478.1 glucokinase [Pseudoduganella flava]TWI51439.1 glucokinase [Pseudoduganella flava]